MLVDAENYVFPKHIVRRSLIIRALSGRQDQTYGRAEALRILCTHEVLSEGHSIFVPFIARILWVFLTFQISL